MTAAHTPGPWHVVRELRPEDETVCDMQNDAFVITKGGKLAWWENDARLIAAAPDLLAALRGLCACITETRGPNADEALFAARAAIAAATSQPPKG